MNQADGIVAIFERTEAKPQTALRLGDVARQMIEGLPGDNLQIESWSHTNVPFACAVQNGASLAVCRIGDYDFVVAAQGRLDNQTELLHQLDMSSHLSSHMDVTLGQLLLHAYQRWGVSCAERLLGSFAFVLWDGQKRQLYCARDHVGACPFFYYLDRNHLIMASEPKGILAHGSVVRQPNLRKLAMLALPITVPTNKNDTYFSDILMLPVATTLTVTDSEAKERRYWALEIEARLDIPVAEIPDAFRELFFQAVAARLPESGPVVALLSGGLDSSSIVATAAHILARQNRRLFTLSAVLPTTDTNDTVKDERFFIDQFRDWENIDQFYITDTDRGPLDDVEQLVSGGEQPIYTSRHYLYSAFAQTVTGQNASILLDGVGGEFGPTFHGNGYYSGLLFSGRWRLLFRELYMRSQHDGFGLMRTARNHLIRPLMPDWLLRLFGRSVVDFSAKEWLRNPLINRAFVQETLSHEENELMRDFVKSSQNHWDHRKNLVRNFELASKLDGHRGFVGYQTIQMSYPFVDKRILEFCVAAPGEVKIHNGYKRYLMRAAMEGILPPAIQWRTTKEPFSPDYHHRYNAQRNQAESFLATIGPLDPVRQIVDVDRLQILVKHQMVGNRSNSTADFGAMHIVPSGIYLIHFLRQFSDFRN